MPISPTINQLHDLMGRTLEFTYEGSVLCSGEITGAMLDGYGRLSLTVSMNGLQYSVLFKGNTEEKVDEIR